MNSDFKETKRYVSRLEGEYKQAMDEVMIHTRFSSIPEVEAEGFILHTLNLLLEAQNHQTSVKEVLNGSPKQYVQEFKREVNKVVSKKKRMMEVVRFIPMGLLIFFITSKIVDLVNAWKEGGFQGKVAFFASDMVGLILGIIMMMFLFSMAKKPKVSKTQWFIVWLASMAYIGSMVGMKLLFPHPLFSAMALPVILGGVLLMVIAEAIYRAIK